MRRESTPASVLMDAGFSPKCAFVSHVLSEGGTSVPHKRVRRHTGWCAHAFSDRADVRVCLHFISSNNISCCVNASRSLVQLSSVMDLLKRSFPQIGVGECLQSK